MSSCSARIFLLPKLVMGRTNVVTVATRTYKLNLHKMSSSGVGLQQRATARLRSAVRYPSDDDVGSDLDEEGKFPAM